MTTLIEVGRVYKLKEDQELFKYGEFNSKTHFCGLKGDEVLVHENCGGLCIVENIKKEYELPTPQSGRIRYYTKTSNLE